MLGKKKKKRKNVTLWPNYPTPVVSNYSVVNLLGKLVRRYMESTQSWRQKIVLLHNRRKTGVLHMQLNMHALYDMHVQADTHVQPFLEDNRESQHSQSFFCVFF